MTQGAGQGPVLRTATLRDFRVPAYVHGIGPTETGPAAGRPEDVVDAMDAMDAVHTEHPAPGPQADPQVDPQAERGGAGEHALGGQFAEVATLRLRAPGAAHPEAPTAPEHSAVADPGTDHTAAAHQDAGAPGRDDHAPVPPAATGSLDAPGALEEPEGYTPTQRDLPVIKRGDTLRMPVVPAADPAPAPANPDTPGPLFVVGDVHGYLSELLAALSAQGIVDAEGRWIAGNARLWFLGDFTDRGPDGIGVIDTVMRLSAEAAAAGGYCKALMGNHELLLLGAKRFGDTPVNSGAGTATFQAAWLLNGGQKTDMDRLQDHHLQWMSRLDAMEQEDGHLLVHSDTTSYLDYGDSIEAVNDTIRETLTRNDADECWDLFRKFTKRFAFRDDNGPSAVRELLSTYGGSRIVHGHSPIPYLLGEVGSEDGEDGEGPLVEGPHVYADGLAIAMDGGVTMAGKLLVCPLPLTA